MRPSNTGTYKLGMGAVASSASVLVHVHGPKFQESGSIDYDIRTMEVRHYPNENGERMLEQVESVDVDFEQG